jgi:methanogenic corrinoid protein MtbC1
MAEGLIYPQAIRLLKRRKSRQNGDSQTTTDAEGIPKNRSASQHRRDEELLEVLERSVLPQLKASPAPAEDFVAEYYDQQVALLATMALQQNLNGAIKLLVNLHNHGISRQALYLDYLGEAARLLGELWRDDRADFANVTLGTSFLQQLMREIRSKIDTDSHFVGHHHSILLVPAPGEQHTFGLSILAEFFRDAGWDVCGGPQLPIEEHLRLVARENFDVIGISAATARVVPELSRWIARIRKAGRGKSPKLMLGGPILTVAPARAAELDVDATTDDAVEAVRIARDLADG